MTITRRMFLGQVAAGTLISATASSATDTFRQSGEGAKADKRIERLGLQLYTVRYRNGEGLRGDAGESRGLRLSGSRVRRLLRSGSEEGAGRSRSQQVRPRRQPIWITRRSRTNSIKRLRRAGSSAISSSSIPGSTKRCESSRMSGSASRRRSTRPAKHARRPGIQFAYHNHHFEFVPVNGVAPFDVLLKECDANLVNIELDLCWTTVARQDPVALFQRNPGRFPLVHVKGLKKIPDGQPPVPFDQAIPNITDVGTDDMIDWKRIFAHRFAGGHSTLLRRARSAGVTIRQRPNERAVPASADVLSRAVTRYCTFCS